MRADVYVIAITYLFSSALASTISSNTFTSGTVKTDQDTTINSGVFYSIVGGSLSTFSGINNQGGFYLTCSGHESTSVTTGGQSFVNSGVTSCNSLDSTASSYFNIHPTQTFRNTGQLFLGLGEVDTSAVGFTITASSSWSNTGMIVLKSSSNSCSANLGGTTISNEGSICLYETAWACSNSISGSGCISIYAGSTFTTSAGSTIPSSQVILLGSASSTFTVSGFASSFGSLLGGSTPSYTVAGFGGSNKIIVDFLFTSYSYNSGTGVLTLVGLLNKVSFNIGKGYDTSYFKADNSVLGLVSKSICYTKDPPNNIPSTCACASQFPTAPTTTLTKSSSTCTTTAFSSSSTVSPSYSTTASEGFT